MANLGPRDTSHLVMLTGWDATELQNFKLADGTSYAEIVGRVNAALGALNTEFNTDWMSNLYSITDQLEVEYRVGSSNGFEVHTEYGLPDAKRAATEGHMLPLIKYDRLLGWTWDYLEEARMPQVDADIADAIKDARDKRRYKILSRLIQRGDDSGDAAGLGTSGYSPGFATTAGSTSVDFVPPAFGGTTFASTHEHCIGIDGGVYTAAVFTEAYDELREHGHEPPFDFLIGPADRAVVVALADFTEANFSLVRPGASTAEAIVPEGYLGTYGGYFQVREVRGMPQYYGIGYKSYGKLSQRNPLRIRVKKGYSAFGVTARTHPNMPNNSPLQNLMLETAFGVGVADRTAGTPRYVNSSTWADGTAT